jgi:DNA-binding transcriptional LysR family regulator
VNLREMEVFRAVMLCGTVKGAGALMHVSQPAASKLLAQAERHAGLRLFERVRGRLVPTQEAHQLYPEIEAVWKSMEKARSVSRELAAPRGGSLRIASTARFCTYLLPQAATALYATFPDLSLHVDMVMPHLVSDAVARGACDLGIAMLPAEHPDIETLHTFHCGLVCVMPEQHRLASKSVIRAADLRTERLIAISQAPPFGHLLERVYGGMLQDMQVGLEVTSGTVACWFAQAGAGIAVVDAPTAAGEVFKGLVTRPFAPSPMIPVLVLRGRNRPLTAAARAFCDCFQDLWRLHVAKVPKPRRADLAIVKSTR